MFQCLKILGCVQQGFTNLEVSELPVKLSMPACFQGKAIPTSIILMELLWQQYGLDVIHPEVSRWLEENAPDVRHAAANNQLEGGDVCHQIKVEQNGTIELRLPLKIDDRLREVSTRYFLSQVQQSIEPETEPRLQAA
jgi:hypothetical protein